MLLEEFAIAMVGILGTALGVIASLIPTQLINSRDNYQRAAGLWDLLKFESNRVISLCSDCLSLIESFQQPNRPFNTDNLAIPVFVRLPVGAGRVVLSNGDFIRLAPKDILYKLGRAYLLLDTVNALIDGYSIFIQVSRSSSNFEQELKAYYSNLIKGCRGLINELNDIDSLIDQQVSINSAKAKAYKILINILVCIGVIGMAIIIVAAVLLSIALITSQMHPLSQPQIQPTVTASP